jgi:hypothetical protein
VIKPPEGNSLEVPRPVETFKAARLLRNGNPVAMKLTDKGLTLTLGANASWDPLDTVIALEIDQNKKTRVLEYTDPLLVCSGGWERARGTCHAINPGSSVEVTFEGSGFSWYGVKSSGHTMAEVSIDGNPPDMVDCYAPERSDNTLCYSKTDLPQGKHVARITIAAKRNPAANAPNGGYIEIQRIILHKTTNPL